MAYTMRHHANAPKNVWDFAILLAWEIYDNSPHSNLPENMSPRQFRTGKLQNIFDYLHIFWALTAIWIPPSQRNKSESKAKFGRYAGYDRQSRSDTTNLLNRWFIPTLLRAVEGTMKATMKG